MIKKLLGGFILILVGMVLLGPVSSEVNTQTMSTTSLQAVSSWGVVVLNLVPGFFALAIFGIGAALIYGALRESGIM